MHDADAFFATDPDGFFGLDVDGELAVTLSVVRYDDSFAFVGFYICRPELRGRGLGVELFDAGLARADATTLGLDGVLEQEPNYARDGFVTAHHSVRFGGEVDLTVPHDDVRVLGAADVDALLDFEREQHVFPAPRRAFLERWITAPGTDRVRGRRRPDRGLRRRRAPAVRATRSARCSAPTAPPPNGCSLRSSPTSTAARCSSTSRSPTPRASALARDLGLEPVFETARMYRGPDPDLRLDRVFGITSFELG